MYDIERQRTCQDDGVVVLRTQNPNESSDAFRGQGHLVDVDDDSRQDDHLQ